MVKRSLNFAQTAGHMRVPIRTRHLLLAAPLAALACGAWADELSTVSANALVLPSLVDARSAPATRQAWSSWRSPSSPVFGSAFAPMPESKFGYSVSAAAKASLVELGVATARQALQDCLDGDYPGGGMGALSLPFGRPTARTAHCRW